MPALAVEGLRSGVRCWVEEGRKAKERKGKEREGKERKGKGRKGKERKGKEGRKEMKEGRGGSNFDKT